MGEKILCFSNFSDANRRPSTGKWCRVRGSNNFLKYIDINSSISADNPELPRICQHEDEVRCVISGGGTERALPPLLFARTRRSLECGDDVLNWSRRIANRAARAVRED
jgi:hypothetical protein